VSFTYRTKGAFIHSIQITLSNGQTSPLFAGPGKDNLSDFKTLQIGDASLIKRVQGTKKGKSMAPSTLSADLSVVRPLSIVCKSCEIGDYS